MKDHVREACFRGEPTSFDRFLRSAMLAIAMYESRSWRRRASDRGRASKLVKEASVALQAFQQTLERIAKWKQLAQYLENLFVADHMQHEQHHILKQQQELQHLRKQLNDAIKRAGELGLVSVEKHERQQQELQPAATPEQRALELVRRRERADLYRSQFRSRSPRVILKQIEPLKPL
jgi:hypothetical protein